jgi:hypothetical protein
VRYGFERVYRRIRLPVAVLFAVAVCFVVIPISFDHLRYISWKKKAVEVTLGDSRAVVLDKMGEPLEQHRPFGGLFSLPDETWVYGRKIILEEWTFPNPPHFYPFRFRLLPEDDDIQVKFDRQGNVKEVVLPRDAG